MSDVFVSYASADRAVVAPLVERLEQRGLSVWWDRDIAAGQNYHQVIEQALNRAKCVVVVWSERSVQSEWVLNEASSARKRRALVPASIDAVEPPLEFRHLQTVNLREDASEQTNEFEQLERSVRQIVGGTAIPFSQEASGMNARPFWQKPVGWMLGAGVFLLGLAALLAVLKQLGWVGSGQREHTEVMPSLARAGAPRNVPVDTVVAPEPAATNSVAMPAEVAARPAAAVTAAKNLLSAESGAQIVAASEEAWRTILEKSAPGCSIISGGSFVVIGLRGEQPTQIGKLAVHVDAESTYNLKTLVLSTADKERGPFEQVAEFDIPNFKNMRAPFHEFSFTPVTTRYVKLQVTRFQQGAGPNGNVCTMRIFAPS